MPIPGAPDPNAVAELSGFLKFLYSLACLIHLPYLALLIGGMVLSLTCKGLGIRRRDPLARRLSRDAVRMALPGGWMVWLPVLAVALNLEIGRRLYRPGMLPLPAWIGLLAALCLGLAMIAGYQSLMRRGKDSSHWTTLLGLWGLVLLAGSCFLLFCGAGQLLMPERWPLLETQPLRTLSWVAVAKFLFFFGFGLALAAVVVLFRRGGMEPGPAGDRYESYVERTGRRVALVFTLLFPLALLLELVNLPPMSLSGPLFPVYGGMVAVAGWLAWRLATGWSEKKGPPCWRLLGALMLVLLLAVTGDHLARNRILTPQTLTEPENWRVWAKAEAAETAPAVSAAKVPADPGQEVFDRICGICHAFDRKIVGPPLLEVLPAYRNEPEKLREFIRNPTKKNPDYPPMPKHGLKDAEIGAVADYLLRRLEE